MTYDLGRDPPEHISASMGVWQPCQNISICNRDVLLPRQSHLARPEGVIRNTTSTLAGIIVYAWSPNIRCCFWCVQLASCEEFQIALVQQCERDVNLRRIYQLDDGLTSQLAVTERGP